LRQHHEHAERDPTRARVASQGQEEDRVRDRDDEQALLGLHPAEPAVAPRPLQQVTTFGDEAPDHPVGEAEEPHLLGARRVHREAVRVHGAALGLGNVRIVTRTPDRAGREEAMRGEPRAPDQDRRPPAVPGEQQRGRESTGERREP
jgi:hypothetical protein